MEFVVKSYLQSFEMSGSTFNESTKQLVIYESWFNLNKTIIKMISTVCPSFTSLLVKLKKYTVNDIKVLAAAPSIVCL